MYDFFGLPKHATKKEVKKYAIAHALLIILSYTPEKYLIITDSKSILYLIISNPFKFHVSLLSTRIRSLTTFLKTSSHTTQLL